MIDKELGIKGTDMNNTSYDPRMMQAQAKESRPLTRIEVLEQKIEILEERLLNMIQGQGESIHKELNEIREAIGLKR